MPQCDFCTEADELSIRPVQNPIYSKTTSRSYPVSVYVAASLPQEKLTSSFIIRLIKNSYIHY